MKKQINKILVGLLIILINTSLYAQFPQIGNDIDGETAYGQSGNAVSLSSDGSVLAIGASWNPVNGSQSGQVKTYEWTGSTWIQRGLDINGDAPADYFGHAISLSSDGNILAISAYRNDGAGTDIGHVRVYEWTGSAWVQRGLDINGETADDWSGWAMSLSSNGNVLAIGTGRNDDNGIDAGHARVYEWTGSSWVQRGGDIDGEAAGDYSGYSVSLSSDGSVVAIGAVNNDGSALGAGHVRVYEWTGSAWSQKGNDIDGEAVGDASGWAMNMSPNGNTLAIGAVNNDGNGSDAGHVRVYEWAGSTWAQKGSDIDGEVAGDASGQAVSISLDGNMVAIAARWNGGSGINAGHVRVFGWTGSAWVQRGGDIDGEAAGDFSGSAVCLNSNGRVLAIGAIGNSENGPDAGHVRVYNLGSIGGRVYQDYNQNCIQENNEIAGISNQTLIIQPGNIVVQTHENGWWFIDSLPVGSYTITANNAQSNWQLTCPPTQAFLVTNPDSLITVPSFGFISNFPCPSPNVSVYAPFLRPGFSNQKVYVQTCNDFVGTDAMDSVYVIVELDTLLTVDTASLPYTSLGSNQYQIYLGDSIYPGQCVNSWLSTTLSTNAILGQTLCMEARVFPVDSCALDSSPNPLPQGITPCLTPYDWSDLMIRAYCDNDTVRFIIHNVGDDNMSCYSPVRLYIDGILTVLDSIMIPYGDSAIFNFAGNGQTLRLEVNQHPLHLGNSNPSATIENCGIGTWTPGLVNILPQDDADPIIDIYCGEVRGSYDPNDKTGFPLGVDTSHKILPNQKIEYLIRFQNTGTDTAFNIVVRDTLSIDLDIFSVKSGVSSHSYDFKIHGPRVLEWTFPNIMLADSNINEPLSHGFVKFEVEQKANLPLGTVINNSASIYFDFNAPIFTNTYSHTVSLDINPFILKTNPPLTKDIKVRIYPNPFNQQATFEVQGKEYERLDLFVYDITGKVVAQKNGQTGNSLVFSRGNLPQGLYVYKLLGNQELINTGKIIVR